MTHDLLRDIVESFDAELERVVITELRVSTYFAELRLRRAGQAITVSSRPSDAVALAVRTGSPLYVADDLMDAEGVLLPPDDDDDAGEGSTSPEEIVGQFRAFLDQVRPEDFSS